MQLRHASAAWWVPHTLIATTCAPAHSQTAGGAGAAEGDQQTLPFITNNITTKRLGQGQASWRAGARPVHPCAPPRCSMVLEAAVPDVHPCLCTAAVLDAAGVAAPDVRPRCHGVPVLCGVVCEVDTPSTLHHKL